MQILLDSHSHYSEKRRKKKGKKKLGVIGRISNTCVRRTWGFRGVEMVAGEKGQGSGGTVSALQRAQKQ